MSLPQWKKDFLQTCVDAGALKFGTFTLKSKRISPYFFNAGLFHRADLLRSMSLAYAQSMKAHGDADAWSIGDYHVPRAISHALCGEQLDDDGCAELLEPFAGHRYRVELLLGRAGMAVERHGARRSLPTHVGL